MVEPELRSFTCLDGEPIRKPQNASFNRPFAQPKLYAAEEAALDFGRANDARHCSIRAVSPTHLLKNPIITGRPTSPDGFVRPQFKGIIGLSLAHSQFSGDCFPASIWERKARSDTRANGCYNQSETLPQNGNALTPL
jgi:hypothetical protein